MNLETVQGIHDWADERRAARITAFLSGNMSRETYDFMMGQIDMYERTRLKRLGVTA